MQSKRPSWPALIGFPLFFLVILGFAWLYRDGLISIFRDREAIRTWILGWGWAGFLAFIALQAFQVIVFIVPGEVVQVAGGWIFGLWSGLVFSVLGIGLGSLVNFAAGRLLGRPFVVSLFGDGRVSQMEGLATSGKGAVAFFLLFAIPGIPKDVLCYVAGLVRLRFGTFMAVSLIGRLPGMLGSSWMGSAARDGDWTVAVAILVVASLLFFVGILFRDRIISSIGQILHRAPIATASKPSASAEELPNTTLKKEGPESP